ncbi:MAG: hypothetical protein WDA00_04400 [Eubacteriales bacterium]
MKHPLGHPAEPWAVDQSEHLVRPASQGFAHLDKYHFKKHPYQVSALYRFFIEVVKREIHTCPLVIPLSLPPHETVTVSAHGLIYAMVLFYRRLCALPVSQTPVICAERDREGRPCFTLSLPYFPESKFCLNEQDYGVRLVTRLGEICHFDFSCFTAPTLKLYFSLRRFRSTDFAVYADSGVNLDSFARAALQDAEVLIQADRRQDCRTG